MIHGYCLMSPSPGVTTRSATLQCLGSVDPSPSPASLAKSHKLKFRGLMVNGGEEASSWLCLRCHDLSWSAHARIIQAGILEAEK